MPMKNNSQTTRKLITPEDAAFSVVRRLNRKGYLALYAGGCVRDKLLGIEPKDYDVATDALPGDVCDLFGRTITVGAKFGVVVVMTGRQAVETATFRTDQGYIDGRRPESVKFTDAREDALRRDFTVNGMFENPLTDEIIDYVGGRKDLQNRIIRTIGNPRHRFDEDYLRMLRAVRFAAQLDFEIEPQTWQAIKRYSDRINNISIERVCQELESIFVSGNPSRGIDLLFESGLGCEIFQGMDKPEIETGISVLSELGGGLGMPLGLAAVFVAAQREKTCKYLKKLKLSNKRYSHALWMLENFKDFASEKIELSRLKELYACSEYQMLVMLSEAWLRATGGDMNGFEKNRSICSGFDRENVIPEPLLTGDDVIHAGCPKGPTVGRILKELKKLQLEEIINTKEQAEEWLKTQVSK
ncbi:CCA-adding enzyme [Limihaloglobus sulfuriphilus]|uniref:CCA-adding enzyme n=1 Tax=Limihaloglobus sulfuriphilus TaxID=1851148 RepID=A0A1Q2MGV5_9BACT|nr:CCA tRNA nucleotidyltransferase [Limihaloglobus sulfuriphilus]AQQ71768.1 CCA-adding enzyme [Limihaloglobus sulfuriphilus]